MSSTVKHKSATKPGFLRLSHDVSWVMMLQSITGSHQTPLTHSVGLPSPQIALQKQSRSHGSEPEVTSGSPLQGIVGPKKANREVVGPVQPGSSLQWFPVMFGSVTASMVFQSTVVDKVSHSST